jgi:hypothetical protein
MADLSPPDIARAIIRQVIARDRVCRLCGRPDQLDAYRHSGPGIAGDGPDNFTAMCAGCMAGLVGKAPWPARYVVAVSEPALAWRRLQVWLAEGLVVAVGAAYVAFVVFLVWAIERVPVTQWGVIADTAIFAGLILGAAVVVHGLLDRWRRRTDARAVGRTMDREAVR